MVFKSLTKGGAAGLLLRWAAGLRFPYLFALTAILFIANLFVPDVLPFADEILMGLLALLVGSLRKRAARGRPENPEAGEPPG